MKLGQKLFHTERREAVTIIDLGGANKPMLAVTESGEIIEVVKDVLAIYSTIKKVIKFIKSIFKK